MAFLTPRTWLDATGVLIDGIAAEWAGTVVGAVPNPRPEEFVLVSRTGGGIDGALDVALMDIEVWSGEPGTSQVPAHQLAGTIREILRMLPTTASSVTRVEEESFAFLPDQVSGAPRCLLSVTAWLKPSASLTS